MKNIKIGIPKALLYFKYKELWHLFFQKLGCQIIISSDTNKEILENGIKFSPDEACMALKIYMGHIHFLQNKCDYILVPRLACLKKDEILCTNFSALYDLIKNTFPTNIIHYNVDVKHNKTEEMAFIKMGKTLGFSKKESQLAYYYAKSRADLNKIKMLDEQKKLLQQKNLKILLAGHPYNLYDQFIGEPIQKLLKENNITLIFSDIYEENDLNEQVKTITKTNYWTYNKEIIAAIVQYEKHIDGIILLTSFPCGPDSLSNEMILRKIKIPIINLILDEADSNTGLITRIESFIDILEERRKRNEERTND